MAINDNPFEMEVPNPQHPQSTDVEMAELANFERMLHAIVTPLFGGYPVPTTHQIGNAMKQAKVLSQSVFACCRNLREQYLEAEGLPSEYDE